MNESAVDSNSCLYNHSIKNEGQSGKVWFRKQIRQTHDFLWINDDTMLIHQILETLCKLTSGYGKVVESTMGCSREKYYYYPRLRPENESFNSTKLMLLIIL